MWCLEDSWMGRAFKENLRASLSICTISLRVLKCDRTISQSALGRGERFQVIKDINLSSSLIMGALLCVLEVIIAIIQLHKSNRSRNNAIFTRFCVHLREIDEMFGLII